MADSSFLSTLQLPPPRDKVGKSYHNFNILTTFSALSAKIAQVRKLPLPYLEQIIPLLRKAGLVESIRGVKGGYRLAKPPEEISVGDVLRALESRSLPLPLP
jgi:DNA-binding IscR family transcriptional regulator